MKLLLIVLLPISALCQVNDTSTFLMNGFLCRNTFSAIHDTLYIIEGIPQNKKPSEDILKNAKTICWIAPVDASAIYGYKGSLGAFLISFKAQRCPNSKEAGHKVWKHWLWPFSGTEKVDRDMTGHQYRMQRRASKTIALYNYNLKLRGVVLYVINGKIKLRNPIINPLVIINPADIEQIEIMKESEAFKKFGKSGENGAILIETKNKEYYCKRLRASQ